MNGYYHEEECDSLNIQINELSERIEKLEKRNSELIEFIVLNLHKKDILKNNNIVKLFEEIKRKPIEEVLG